MERGYNSVYDRVLFESEFESMIDPKMRHATFFCGYGGSCSGAMEAGLECSIAIDNNDRIKVPLKKGEKGDMSFMDGEQGVDWEWHERLPAIQTREKNLKDGAGRIMGVDEFIPGPEHAARFVTASPPCKRFSTSAETWVEDKDEDEYTDDDKWLDELDRGIKELGYVAIDKAVAIPEMEYYIMENVTGLANERNHSYLLGMIKKLRSLGFSVEWNIYNAHDFGACQMRERLILVASKNRHENLLPVAPVGIKKKIFQDIMEDGKSKASRGRIEDARWSQSTYLTFVAKMMRGAGQMRIVIPSSADAAAAGWHPKALAAFPHVDVLPTIACNAGGGPTRKKWAILPFDGHGYRNATRLEGLRAQTHDDAWLANLPKNDALAWNMIGNAVPKCLMAAIMRHLQALDKYYDGKGSCPPSSRSKDDDYMFKLPQGERVRKMKSFFAAEASAEVLS